MMETEKGAVLSDCRLYRYRLWRTWDAAKPSMPFIGLNPSTADEMEDDPTIRRCMGFARAWDYGGIEMLNIFAFRATSPKDMKAAKDPVGEWNTEILVQICKKFKTAVACWGSHGSFMGRSEQVRKLGLPLRCFGTTKAGEPKHPLYLPKDSQLIDFL